MFNHWATGLQSGLLPEDCCIATPELYSRGTPYNLEVCLMVLVPGARDIFFPNNERFRVLVGVKGKVSPPRLPGNVRFGQRIGANGGSTVTIPALRG